MDILEKKIELWVVVLVALLGVVGMIVWGNIAVHTQKGGTRAGIVGDAVLEMSSLPELVERATNAHRYLVAGDQNTFAGKSGFEFSYPPGARPDAGYLLLSRYDGNDKRSYVEFVDLNAQKIIHRWSPDIDAINARSNFKSTEIDLVRDKNVHRMLLRHPFLTEDGGIIFQSRTPLTKIDACSNVVWINDTHLFHHALERDSNGIFWISAVQNPPTIPNVSQDKFLDDSITGVDAGGKIIFIKSVSRMLIENGLSYLVYGMRNYTDDPIHLNDIQPADRDGQFWKRGDLFLSLRSLSTILIYRPSTNKIIWRKEGPWSLQHDVDILDDHRISVFNNNGANYQYYNGTLGPAEVMIYDFSTDTVSSPWKEAMARLDVRAATESLATVLPGGGLFFEEQNHGRLMRITDKGESVWTYINHARDGHLYRVGWSRILSAEEGGAIARKFRASSCVATGR